VQRFSVGDCLPLTEVLDSPIDDVLEIDFGGRNEPNLPAPCRQSTTAP